MEWNTTKENIMHAWGNGFCKITQKHIESARLVGIKNTKAVVQYDIQGNIIRAWGSIKEASEQLNIGRFHIGECCKGKRKTTGRIYLEI